MIFGIFVILDMPGIAIANITASITITASNSTKVNPFSF